MGLASKLAAAQAAQNTQGGAPAPAPAAYGQQQPPQQQSAGGYGYGAPPAGAPGQPRPAGSTPGQYGSSQSSQPSQQPQQSGSSPYPPTSYGQAPAQQKAQQGQQQPGAYKQQQQYGNAPGSYQQQPQQAQQPSQGQYGAAPPAPAYGSKPPQQQQYGGAPGGYQQQPPSQGQYGAPQQPPSQGQYGAPQQGQYGAPQQQQQQQQQQQGGTNYLNILQAAVRENGLEAFYNNDQLSRIASTLEPKINDAANKWRIPKEIAVDLSRLALYDVIIYADDSGSMSFEENGERIDDLKLILTRAAYVASLFDDDGIQVRFMNNTIEGNGLRSDQQVIDLISRVQFRGLTPLGTELKKKVLDPLVVGPARNGTLRKPVLLLTITDGTPAGESDRTIFDVISRAKNELSQTRYRSGAAAFQFAQVGNDIKARQFLAKLDTDPVVGRIVDVTSNFESEQDEMAKLGVNLDPATWLVKMLLGAIDPSYDTQDEQK